VAILLIALWRDRSGTPRLGLLLRGGLLALLWLDAQTHTPQIAPVIANGAYAGEVAELNPKPRAGLSRVMLSPRAEVLLLTRTLPSFLNDFLGARLALWSNLNVLEGVPKVNGAATLQLREQAEIEARLYAVPTNAFPRLEEFLGVSHGSSPDNPVEWAPRAAYAPFITVGAQPRFAGEAETLRALFSPDFDARREVFLPPAAEAVVAARSNSTAQIISSRVTAHGVEAEIDSSVPVMTVIAQSFYHPWRAFVDGQPTRLWRANHAFQAVELPPGRRRLWLVYVDSRFRAGAWVSALTLAGCAAAWVGARRKPRGSTSRPNSRSA
jgi:hypothetical protein